MAPRRSVGLTLLEAVLALALTATLLVSVAGLFAVGAQQLRASGRETQALAVALSILEEAQGWSYHQTYRTFGRDGTAARYALDSRVETRAARWQRMIDDAGLEGRAVLVLESIGADSPPPLRASRAMRVAVIVHWSTPRPRSLRLATARM